MKTIPNPNKLIGSFNYRPEVDGLRAIAVLAVVLYHAGLGVSGGYVGVDVFFVISGYLITSLIIKEIEADKFSLANFWERRARRIIPAAVVLVIATLGAGWFLLLPSDYEKLGNSAIAHAVFSANIYFWRTTNYFAGAADEQPLLHTWSLAVEEQFYLVFPFVLLALSKLRRLRTRLGLLSVFGITALLSLALSIWTLPRMPAVTFYLLPTRAWELLLGSIVALVPPAISAGRSSHLLTATSWAGLAAILIPCFTYTSETSFPGFAALPPCLGAALFIWSTLKQNAEDPLNLPASILATRPLVFIGLISYSLYLWHWPFFAFSIYWALEPLSLPYRIGMVAIGLICAVLSWHFVETPFRKRSFGKSRTRMFGYAGTGLAISVAVAVTITNKQGYRDRFLPEVLAFDNAKREALHENRITKTVELKDAVEGHFPQLGNSDSDHVQVLVWGDSHARSILPGIDQLARQRGVSIETAWHSSTPPVLGFIPDAKFAGFSLGNDCPAFNQAIIEHIQERQIQSVILAARWSGYFKNEVDARHEPTFGMALVATVKTLKKTGTIPWIVMEVPNHKATIPKVLARREVLQTDIKKYLCTSEELLKQNREMLLLRPALEAAGARFIDFSPLLFDDQKQVYRPDWSGNALYYDHHHLTRAGSRYIAKAFLPAFAE